MSKSDKEIFWDSAGFARYGLGEAEKRQPKESKMKRVWRSTFWWYNWFDRAVRRHSNFWGSECNTYGIKNHSCSYNTKISNATLKVFAKYNCPVDDRVGGKLAAGTNQHIYKINKYNKYKMNRRLSVFNAKQ